MRFRAFWSPDEISYAQNILGTKYLRRNIIPRIKSPDTDSRPIEKIFDRFRKIPLELANSDPNYNIYPIIEYSIKFSPESRILRPISKKFGKPRFLATLIYLPINLAGEIAIPALPRKIRPQALPTQNAKTCNKFLKILAGDIKILALS